MSWPYAVVFALFALASATVGIVGVEPTHGISLTLFYPVLSFTLVSGAYSGGGPDWLGKGPDGGRAILMRLLLAPYLVLNRFIFVLYKRLAPSPATCEVIPKLFLGRRLTSAESRHFMTAAVVDLAVEFSEARLLRGSTRYLSLPVLDATSPTVQQLDRAVWWLTQHLPVRPVFVHCALGHGRSACVVLAYLLHIRMVTTVRDGLRVVRRGRPGVGLSTTQRQTLEEWWAARNPAGDA